MINSGEYMKHSKIANLYAHQFVSEIVSTTGWGDTPLGTVMDIGCGPGNTSTHWIDHYLPNIEKLIGFDIDPGMIALAKQQNKKENIEFHVANIMEKNSLAKWTGQVSRIFSLFVLHWASDQKTAFRNIYDLLQPSGEAALQFIVEENTFKAFEDLLKIPKWNPILKPLNITFPEGYVKKYDAEYYRRMFVDVGFKVSSCEIKPFPFTLESDVECQNFLMSLFSIGDVSEELKAEYKKDFFDRYMSYSERDKNGRPIHSPVVLQAVLRKDH